jgi:GNAT superfamily N-acetyltransferase
MSACQVRRFVRADRDQVTSLVNAHIAAVVPAVGVSVSGLMSQLEREPGEFIVDPWVIERVTLVAEQRQRVVAAAHLLRYADDARVGDSYRGAGEIRWLVHWPDAPFWPDATAAGDALAEACVAQLRRWNVTRYYADGALPAPGVYGVPEQWPHIRDLYHRAGFREDDCRFETIFLARVSDLGKLGTPAQAGDLSGAGNPLVTDLVGRRTLGINGTRISAVQGNDVVGYIEVESRDESPRTLRTRGWADVGNFEVAPGHSRTTVGTWLLAQAADWLDLGGVTHLLSYADTGDATEEEFLTAVGFRVLTRTIRGLAIP